MEHKKISDPKMDKKLGSSQKCVPMIKILLNHRGHGGHRVGNKLTETIMNI
jgi:hypothetical protein